MSGEKSVGLSMAFSDVISVGKRKLVPGYRPISKNQSKLKRLASKLPRLIGYESTILLYPGRRLLNLRWTRSILRISNQIMFIEFWLCRLCSVETKY